MIAATRLESRSVPRADSCTSGRVASPRRPHLPRSSMSQRRFSKPRSGAPSVAPASKTRTSRVAAAFTDTAGAALHSCRRGDWACPVGTALFPASAGWTNARWDGAPSHIVRAQLRSTEARRAPVSKKPVIRISLFDHAVAPTVRQTKTEKRETINRVYCVGSRR
jgi:hypothetical protein